ncbi:hypothetical protein M422DRAFT_52249 [Sphaerobolus stellatus SS14]|nr:hypothetical protein M422DRAFT_52249 [Sphaerobolus stellatus SS14]
MVILDNDRTDYRRLSSFYKAFDSSANLTIEDSKRLFVLMESPQYYWFWQTCKLGILLALGIVKWPTALLPNSRYVELLIYSLEAPKPLHIREVALQAAWCYRNQLESISDNSLRIRLLSALVTAAASLELWPLIEEDNAHIQRLTGHLSLIRSICRYSHWHHNWTDYENITKFVSQLPKFTVQHDMRIGVDYLLNTPIDPYYATADLFHTTQILKETLSPSSSTEEKLDLWGKPAVVSVWQFISSRSQEDHLLSVDYRTRIPTEGDPFRITDETFWQALSTICNWSVHRILEIDSMWVSEVSRHVEAMYISVMEYQSIRSTQATKSKHFKHNEKRIIQSLTELKSRLDGFWIGEKA